ncbi:uncharacterized protein EMH_0087290 [Eimeria mitis]|uniref:Uncharacterized protein n=1 Tax=Eimeria mitis TaxID=44415 RepID=U6KB50_9EIME|nr:uncharacterized protein EMH_0087290 [Eimeria mitis]CDJ34021.1 hypothetical protein, conserved [Eimeria mitis]
MVHIFAAGMNTWNDGSIYHLAAVCSTLDISVLGQGIRHAKVVSSDNRKQTEELQLKVNELVATVREEEKTLGSMSSRVDELAEQWEDLTRSIEDTHSNVMKQMELVQQLEAQAAAFSAELAAREAAATAKCEELNRQLEYLQLRIDETEQLSQVASSRQQSASDDGDEDE